MRIAYFDVLVNGIVKQVYLLKNLADKSVETLLRNMAYIYSADGDTAFGYIPKAGDEWGNSGFTRTWMPHQSDHTVLRHCEIQIAKGLLIW